MKNLFLSISALCFFISATSMANAAEKETCDLEVRTNNLKNVKSELSTELQKLSTIKSCALDFDNSVKTTKEIVTLAAQLENLGAQVSTLQQSLDAVVEQIQQNSKTPENEAVDTDFNKLLAERLAYRGQVKTWQLRSSEQFTGLETELAKITGDIDALQKRIDGVSDWQDQAVLDDLLVQEAKHTQALAEVQRRLTGLEQKRADPKYTAAQEFEAEGPGRTSALGDAIEGLAAQIQQLERDLASEQTSKETAKAQVQELDMEVTNLASQLEAMKANQSTLTEGLASAQIEKTRLSPILQDLNLQETLLSSELQTILPQAEATASIVDQLVFNVSEKANQIVELDSQILLDTDSVASLQKRVGEANQNITAIQSQMSNEFKSLSDFQNAKNQVFALELTIGGLDKEIDNLDMRATGAEGKLNRFLRTCKRKPACKSALNL